MANITGIPYMNPGVVSDNEIVTTGVSISGNNRILCILGEGTREEVIVNSANGNGKDGWDAAYTSQTKNTDGRHFKLSKYPVISNRTTLYLNGVPLKVKEEAISATPLNPIYDARLDVASGKIELKGASLVDQGGLYYAAYGGNIGNGTLSITASSLIDSNAPSENWTIRCNSVRKDGYGQPIDGYAKFVVSGSVSGVVLDGYGSPVIWQSDGTVRSNGILQFAITEGATKFNIGDTFTAQVASGVLSNGNKLSAEYIATIDLNDPELFTDLDSIKQKHGTPSLKNTISLAAQLAFANQTTAVLCSQAMPAIPRRSWFKVVDTATGGQTPDDMKFVLPTGVYPDTNSDVKFVIVDSVTGTETQIIPNKVGFYDPTITNAPDTFINTAAPYSYTVVKNVSVKHNGEDLVITPTTGPTPGTYYATISSASAQFGIDDYNVNTTVHIFGSTNNANNGTFQIAGVNNGKLTITNTSAAFVADDDLSFRVLDSSANDTAYVLMTKDLYLSQTQGLKVGVIDTRDAEFYDVGWISALEKLESFELDILTVFPTQTKSAIIQNALQHCIAMSRNKNRKERVLFTGAIQGLTPSNITGVKLAAVEDLGVIEGIQGDDVNEILSGDNEDLANYSIEDNFGATFRCVYHYPDRIVVNIEGSNTYVDGMFLGAAHGGLLAGTGNVSLPSTNKIISGFSILKDRTYNVTVSENITKAGACLIEPVAGGGNIVWGKTTSASGFAEDEEISIVFIRDAVAKLVRGVLKGFIGQAESKTFLVSATNRVDKTLNAVNGKLITDYKDVLVKRDDVEPRQFNVRFAIQPIYSINWIWVKFSVGLFS